MRRQVKKERGALLGIVMVLLVLILAASGFAFWGLRGETQSAGTDRLAHQLFDCAEQALAIGKQRFGTYDRKTWDDFLFTDVCATLPCTNNGGPFPTGATGTPPVSYPGSAPYQDDIIVGTGNYAKSFRYNVGLYNNNENVVPTPKCSQLVPDTTCKYHDGDSVAVVWARCTDLDTGLSRVTQAVINAPVQTSNCPYRGMAGAGCRGQGNQN
jgi:hypothetical protein